MATLAPLHNGHFRALQLPSDIRIDADRGRLVLPHYAGEDLVRRWDETDGGASLDLDLAVRIPVVLADLAEIDARRITADPVLSKIPGLVFDFEETLARSTAIARRLVRAGLINPDDCATAVQLACSSPGARRATSSSVT
ncbi:MAG: hypothetical protein ACRDXC_03540 [Acidimicrobiales bacterium]